GGRRIRKEKENPELRLRAPRHVAGRAGGSAAGGIGQVGAGHRSDRPRQRLSDSLISPGNITMRITSAFTAALVAGTLAITAPSLASDTTVATTRIVFPFAAGGSGDALARLVAERIQPLLKRTVVVENRTGGSGMIGIATVKSAPK